jgi:hypothetical protein
VTRAVRLGLGGLCFGLFVVLVSAWCGVDCAVGWYWSDSAVEALIAVGIGSGVGLLVVVPAYLFVDSRGW